jgi:hypothetical protein
MRRLPFGPDDDPADCPDDAWDRPCEDEDEDEGFSGAFMSSLFDFQGEMDEDECGRLLEWLGDLPESVRDDLDEDQYCVLEMMASGDEDEEIAEHLECSLESVCDLRDRAVEKIRDYYLR